MTRVYLLFNKRFNFFVREQQTNPDQPPIRPGPIVVF